MFINDRLFQAVVNGTFHGEVGIGTGWSIGQGQRDYN